MTRRSSGLFAPAFALVYGVLYAAKQPVFLYYPLHRVLALERLPATSGPGMLWYGWLTAGLVAGTATVLLVPARWTTRVPAAVSWLTVLAAMLLIAAGELHGLFA